MVELGTSDMTLVEVDENAYTVTFHYKKTRRIFFLTPENSTDREDLQYWWNAGYKRIIPRGSRSYAQDALGKWQLVDLDNKQILESISNPLESIVFLSELSPDGYIIPSVRIRRIKQKQKVEA